MRVPGRLQVVLIDEVDVDRCSVIVSPKDYVRFRRGKLAEEMEEHEGGNATHSSSGSCYLH